jgi:hypothetical protein
MNLTGSKGRCGCSRMPMPRSEASRIVNEQMSFRMRRRAPQLDDVRSNALLSNSFSRSPNVVISRSCSHPRPRKMSGQDANHQGYTSQSRFTVKINRREKGQIGNQGSHASRRRDRRSRAQNHDGHSMFARQQDEPLRDLRITSDVNSAKTRASRPGTE